MIELILYAILVVLMLAGVVAYYVLYYGYKGLRFLLTHGFRRLRARERSEVLQRHRTILDRIAALREELREPEDMQTEIRRIIAKDSANLTLKYQEFQTASVRQLKGRLLELETTRRDKEFVGARLVSLKAEHEKLIAELRAIQSRLEELRDQDVANTTVRLRVIRDELNALREEELELRECRDELELLVKRELLLKRRSQPIRREIESLSSSIQGLQQKEDTLSLAALVLRFRKYASSDFQDKRAEMERLEKEVNSLKLRIEEYERDRHVSEPQAFVDRVRELSYSLSPFANWLEREGFVPQLKRSMPEVMRARRAEQDQPIVAGWGLQFWSWVVDSIIVLLALQPAGAIASMLPSVDLSLQSSFFSFSLLSCVFFLYFTLLEWKLGSSLGKRVLGLRVFNSAGRPIDLRASAIQSFGKAFLLPLDVLVGLILFHEHRQRLFSRLAGTVVTRAPSKKRVSGLSEGPMGLREGFLVCKGCGRSNTPQANFCDKCGLRLGG